MAKKNDQPKLLDTDPENVKPLIKAARKYRATIADRLSIQQTEAEQKAELRELVAASGLEPLDDGKILFKYEDVTIKVDPPGEGKITVTVDDED